MDSETLRLSKKAVLGREASLDGATLRGLSLMRAARSGDFLRMMSLRSFSEFSPIALKGIPVMTVVRFAFSISVWSFSRSTAANCCHVQLIFVGPFLALQVLF